MGYFNGSGLYGDYFAHQEKKRDLNGESISSEKGTDGKANNTSEYNHDYYENNKEKWSDNKSSSKKKSTKSNDDDRFYDKDGKARFGHKDYDENDEDFKRTDGDKIGNTNLRQFVNKNGSTIIMGDGIKFSFPPGTKISAAMAKQIENIEKGDKSNKEAYVAKMLNAVTGFADKQGLNTDTAGKKKSSSKKSSEEKSEESGSSSKSSGKVRSISEAYEDQQSNKNKTKKTTEEQKKQNEKDANDRWHRDTNYYKKQQQAINKLKKKK